MSLYRAQIRHRAACRYPRHTVGGIVAVIDSTDSAHIIRDEIMKRFVISLDGKLERPRCHLETIISSRHDLNTARGLDVA